MQSFAFTPARIAKYKGEILKHAVPVEVLNRLGRQIPMPKHMSDTVVFRRWLPYKATSTNQNTQNRFFQDGTGDRANVIVQENQIAEGVTPAPNTITPVDITVVVQQYGCLYGFTDKTYNLYEDDIPKAMTEQIGERVTFRGHVSLQPAQAEEQIVVHHPTAGPLEGAQQAERRLLAEHAHQYNAAAILFAARFFLCGECQILPHQGGVLLRR